MTTVPPQHPQHPGEPEGGFFALMRHRNYALLWGGQLISHLGDRFLWVAISLWVYAQTGSALSVSFAIVALMVAPAVVGLFAGALVDRLDRRKMMIVTDVLRAGLVAAIPTLMHWGLPWVYAALFLVSAGGAFFRPAMFAAIPQSVPKERLLQANAFFASLESAVEVAGPAMAGLLVARFQYAAAIYVDALSYLVSAVFVTALSLPRAKPEADGARGRARPRARPGLLASIREGLRYIRGDQVHVALLVFLFSAQWVVGLSSLQTPLAKGVIGITDREFGWFQSVWGLGFVGASLMLGWYGRQIARGQAVVLGYGLWALAAAAMGLSRDFLMLSVAGFWVGFANIVVFVNVSTIMMEHTPSDRIGRAITVRQIGVSLVRVSALLGFGWLADEIGIRPSIMAMAGLSLFGTAFAASRLRVVWTYRGASAHAGPTASRSRISVAIEPQRLPQSRTAAEGLAEPIWSVALSRVARARTDPDFVASEQRWLNAATLAIVAAGWVHFLFAMPRQAIGTALSIGGAFVAAGYVRRWTGPALIPRVLSRRSEEVDQTRP